ncbi:ComF family protein [Paenibacillus xylanilyticus]|uniref:ComF family protein n=1 Tax=Paenibacillus xylanilyticus TaxID=248903 RepID=UPI00129E3A96|nr:ComF family protein [Paenibacillus xylanilyticus]
MLNRLNDISDFVHQLTHRIHNLLAPPGATCLTCGTRAVLSPTYPGICARCAQQIPWIRSIRCLRCGRAIGCPDCIRPHMNNRSFICNRSAVQYNALMKEWIGMYKFRGHVRYAPLLTTLLIQAFQAMSEEMSLVAAKETQVSVAHSATSTLPPVDASLHPPSPRASTHARVQHSNAHASTAVRANLQAATRQPKLLLPSPKPRWRPDAVTYVPVSNERLAERGFNQAERLASGLAAACRLPVVDLLQRRINTTKQSFKTRAERFETMKEAFSISPGAMDILRDFYKDKAEFHSAIEHSCARALRLLLIDDIYTTGSTLDACGRVILHVAVSFDIPIEIYTLTMARS